MIDIKKLAERGYEDIAGKVMSEKLSTVDPMFISAIKQWLDSGSEMDFEISGIKLSELKNKYSLTYAAAILSMDWLLRDPESAKRSFERGIK